jgi:type IV secretion system protein VirD4
VNSPPPLGVLILAGLVGVVTIAVGTVWLASYIALPLLKVPMSAHEEFIFVRYWNHYPELRQGPLAKALMISLALICAPLLLFFAKKPRPLHGDAKFATNAQVKKAGLLADRGIIVGKRGTEYLVFGGQQHVLMSAPTRSGKGVGVVIPNLLNWPDSVVVLDIKQENWNLTAGFRAEHGQACYLFNPAAEDRRTHCYNPLDYISKDRKSVV